MGSGVLLVDSGGRPASEGVLETGDELRAAAGAVLQGALVALGKDRLGVHGYDGADHLTVAQLADLWRPGNRSQQIGTAFEIAVERAFGREGEESDRLLEAMHSIGFGEVSTPSAFLFGPEKAARRSIVREAHTLLTETSTVWRAGRGRRMYLRPYLGDLVYEHEMKGRAGRLPSGYQALWKADVFLGCLERDLWVGVSCKASRTDVVPAGDAVPFAVAPGTPTGRGDARPFAYLSGMPTVSFPVKGTIWSNLERMGTALRHYMELDGRLAQVRRDIAPDLQLVLQELNARRDHRASEIAEEWLYLSGADVRRIWTPSSGTPIAA